MKSETSDKSEPLDGSHEALDLITFFGPHLKHALASATLRDEEMEWVRSAVESFPDHLLEIFKVIEERGASERYSVSDGHLILAKLVLSAFTIGAATGTTDVAKGFWQVVRSQQAARRERPKGRSPQREFIAERLRENPGMTVAAIESAFREDEDALESRFYIDGEEIISRTRPKKVLKLSGLSKAVSEERKKVLEGDSR